eukprot:5482142-Heterocapsa_arctica.AAC.1
MVSGFLIKQVTGRGIIGESADTAGQASQGVAAVELQARTSFGVRRPGWASPAGWCGCEITGKDIIGGPQTCLAGQAPLAKEGSRVSPLRNIGFGLVVGKTKDNIEYCPGADEALYDVRALD